MDILQDIKPKGRDQQQTQVTVSMPQSFSGSDEISNLPLSQAQCQQLSAFIKSQVSINQVDSNPQAANVISQPHTNQQAANVMLHVSVHSNSIRQFFYLCQFYHLLISNALIFSSRRISQSIFSIHDWIIDNGATDYAVHSVSCFISATAITHTPVQLPNGDLG